MKIILKKNREKPLLNRHPWIFSGSILRIDGDVNDGSISEVVDYRGALLGHGFYNGKSQIAVRMLTFGGTEFHPGFFRERVLKAINQRSNDPSLKNSDSYRIIYSESDGIPGLIVDRYNDNLVIQILTLGIEARKNEITGILAGACSPSGIYERSDHPGRILEGLKEYKGQIYGSTPDEIEINENGMRFLVNVKTGQKTGFYLDQRENRSIVKTHSMGRRALNLFSYSGGFTVAAFMGGAASVISVDSSRPSMELLKKNLAINGLGGTSDFIEENAFEYVRNHEIESDFIIIDPPALIKKRDDLIHGSRAYKDINMHVFKKCPTETFVLTCSCSRFIDFPLFQKIIFSAMLDAGRTGCIVRRAGHPSDHPVSLYHPESEYLKSLLLYIR